MPVCRHFNNIYMQDTYYTITVVIRNLLVFNIIGANLKIYSSFDNLYIPSVQYNNVIFIIKHYKNTPTVKILGGLIYSYYKIYQCM